MKKKIIAVLTGLLVLMLAAGAAFGETVKFSYEDMVSAMQAVADRYPEETELRNLGETVDGRKLLCLRVGKKGTKRNILVFGAIHAREYITAELVMKLAEDYCSAYHSGTASYKGLSLQELTNDTSVYFIPMANPDGVTISQYGISKIQKDDVKRRIYHIFELDQQSKIEPYLEKWKSNAEGIDLNRQFDAKWEQYNDRVGHPSSDHYKGTAPGTAVEAKALIDLTESESFSRTISYHTQGQVIYWYFAQKGTLLEESKKFAEAISSVTGYRMDANYEQLDPAGYKDWAISKKGIPSLTIEVGSGTNPLPHEQINTMWKENQKVVYETLYNNYLARN